jgi:hypothetical protein
LPVAAIHASSFSAGGEFCDRTPGKERATLFDMIVLPPDLGRETLEVERNLLKKELRRLLEFADLADNAGEAQLPKLNWVSFCPEKLKSILLQLQRRYGLLDL